MGMIGRWIDSLTDDDRDRIIEHPDPTYDGQEWWDDVRDCGCLVGCVVAGRDCASSPWTLVGKGSMSCDEGLQWDEAGLRFPDLTYRFTPEQMWRLVKARAARNRVAIPGVRADGEAPVSYRVACR